MNRKKILFSLISFMVIVSMFSSISFAANKFIGVTWWNQPDPNSASKYWKEAANGALEMLDLGANGTSTIAYVPAGYAAGADSKGMPRDFDVTVDLIIPDVNEFPDSWAGFYIRASAPQTGTSGYVIHMNSDGLAVFDGESATPIVEERIKGELFRVNDWNRVRATLIAKELKIWVNGVEAYTYKNCMTGPGYLGLTAINFKSKFRNYKLIADGKNKSEAFIVAGTSAAIKPPAASSTAASSKPEASSAAASSESVAESSAIVSSEASSVTESSEAVSSQEVSSEVVSTPEKDTGSLTTIILIIAIIVVVAGGIAGYIISKKKRGQI